MISTSTSRSSSSSSVLLNYAFQKQRQYKKLTDLCQHFVNRGAGFENWVVKLDVLKTCMELPWEILILKECYQNSEREYLEIYSRARVFKNIFHMLEEVINILGVLDGFDNETTSAAKAEDMEFNFSSVVDALQQVSSTKVTYKSIKPPHQLSAHEQKYWTKQRSKLEDAEYGKIVVRAWEVPGLSSLCAGEGIVVEDFEGEEVALTGVNKQESRAESRAESSDEEGSE